MSAAEKVWGPAGYATPDVHEQRREHELHAADPCTCRHRKDEHFPAPKGCWHHSTMLHNSSQSWHVRCTCEGFEDAL